MNIIHLAHDSAVLRTLPLSGSLNRWICGSLPLAQIPLRGTSDTLETLGEMLPEMVGESNGLKAKSS